MRTKILPAVVTLMLLLCAAALAQQPQLAVYPDITTAQNNAGVALLAYKSVVEGNIATVFQLEQNDSAAIGSTNSTVAALQGQISGMQAQLNAQAATIATIQAQIATMQKGTPSQSSVIWATFLDGPINGIQGAINYGTGFWCAKGGELAACADNQPSRSLTFAAPVTITSITFSTTTVTTTGLKLTSQSGQIATCTAAAINQDSSCTPAWSTPVTSFTVTSTNGNAPDLRIRTISYTQ